MALEHESDTALARAVRIAGSQSAFGRLIGKRQSTISDWLRNDRPLPAEHVIATEVKTGVSRHDLRPDIYPREPIPAAAPTPTDRYNGAQP
jgi:DNA-binding transcriptional regulator YdaS (Cro superfamily)